MKTNPNYQNSGKPPTHLGKFNPGKYIDPRDMRTFFNVLKFSSQEDRDLFLNGPYGSIVRAKDDSNNEVVFIWANKKGEIGLYSNYMGKYTIEFNDPKLAESFVKFCNLEKYTTISKGYESKVTFNEQDIYLTEILLPTYSEENKSNIASAPEVYNTSETEINLKPIALVRIKGGYTLNDEGKTVIDYNSSHRLDNDAEGRSFFCGLKFTTKYARDQFLKGQFAPFVREQNPFTSLSNDNEVYFASDRGSDTGLYISKFTGHRTIEFGNSEIAKQFVDYCNLKVKEQDLVVLFESKVEFKEQPIEVTEIPLFGDINVNENHE